MAAFERMEEKVEAMEATGQAAAELAGSDLESQFAALESGNDVDDELAALRASLPAVLKPSPFPQVRARLPRCSPSKWRRLMRIWRS